MMQPKKQMLWLHNTNQAATPQHQKREEKQAATTKTDHATTLQQQKQTMPQCRSKTNHVAMLQQPKEPHHDATEKQTINDAAAATKTCRDTVPS